eukprot:6194846-Pleurochrysis_carterae.AAC.1
MLTKAPKRARPALLLAMGSSSIDQSRAWKTGSATVSAARMCTACKDEEVGLLSWRFISARAVGFLYGRETENRKRGDEVRR